jgi:hypothetical protein
MVDYRFTVGFKTLLKFTRFTAFKQNSDHLNRYAFNCQPLLRAFSCVTCVRIRLIAYANDQFIAFVALIVGQHSDMFGRFLVFLAGWLVVGVQAQGLWVSS